MSIFYASLLAANPLHLETAIEECLRAGIDSLHLDVMDMHYVPNLALNIDTIKAIVIAYPKLALDIHIMSTKPLAMIQQLQQQAIQPERIFFHLQTWEQCNQRIRSAIHKLGAKAGICLNPNDHLNAFCAQLPHYDAGLIMGVQPGFCGQSMYSSTPDRLDTILKQRRTQQHRYQIGVDGGVNCTTLAQLSTQSPDFYMVGSALMAQSSLTIAAQQLQAALG